MLKESGPPLSDDNNDGDNEINFEVSKLSKVLSEINVCRCQINVKIEVEKI